MVVALKEVKIRGEIRTLVDYAIDMIQVGITGTLACTLSLLRLCNSHAPCKACLCY